MRALGNGCFACTVQAATNSTSSCFSCEKKTFEHPVDGQRSSTRPRRFMNSPFFSVLVFSTLCLWLVWMQYTFRSVFMKFYWFAILLRGKVVFFLIYRIWFVWQVRGQRCVPTVIRKVLTPNRTSKICWHASCMMFSQTPLMTRKMTFRPWYKQLRGSVFYWQNCGYLPHVDYVWGTLSFDHYRDARRHGMKLVIFTSAFRRSHRCAMRNSACRQNNNWCFFSTVLS